MFNRITVFTRCCASSFKRHGSCATSVHTHNKNGNCFTINSLNIAELQHTTPKQITVENLLPFVSYAHHSKFSYSPYVRNKVIISDMFNTSKSEVYFPSSGKELEKIEDIYPDIHIEAPQKEEVSEKQAARLIVIRRRKMKKHKLRKLRKRMKFEWAKVRQRREYKKEKLFQAELIAQIKEAEKFNAASYVAERLEKATAVQAKKNWFDKHL